MPDTLRDLRILNAIAAALNQATTLEGALQETLERVTELLGLRTGWVWLADPESGHYYRAASLNLPPYLQEPVRMTGSPCWCLQAFQGGELTPQNVDVMECSRLRPAVRAHLSEVTAGLSYHASIPLYAGDVPLGILNVTGPSGRQVAPHELHLLSTIGYQVGNAVARFRLAEEATRLARVEERATVARTLHDTLVQGLTAIVLHAESALRALPDRPQAAAERLQVVLNTARDSLEEARHSVLHLRGGALRGQPLGEALVRLARTFTGRTGVPVVLKTEALPGLTLRAETELYHIVQEALSNVERHAHAREVTVALKGEGRQLRLTVFDNGVGFERRVSAAGGHGLLGMRERVRLLGGRLSIRGRPGLGTRLTVTVST